MINRSKLVKHAAALSSPQGPRIEPNRTRIIISHLSIEAAAFGSSVDILVSRALRTVLTDDYPHSIAPMGKQSEPSL